MCCQTDSVEKKSRKKKKCIVENKDEEVIENFNDQILDRSAIGLLNDDCLIQIFECLSNVDKVRIEAGK